MNWSKWKLSKAEDGSWRATRSCGYGTHSVYCKTWQGIVRAFAK